MLRHGPSSTLFPYTTLFRSLVSISDRATQGEYQDEGIPALQQWLDEALIQSPQYATRLIADEVPQIRDRKSTRLNSSHVAISYAVFCSKKKNKKQGEYI